MSPECIPPVVVVVSAWVVPRVVGVAKGPAGAGGVLDDTTRGAGCP